MICSLTCVSVCGKKHVFDSSCGHLVFHQPRDPQQKQDACSKALQEPAKVVKIVKTQTPKAQRLETLCTSFELQVQKIRIYSQDSTLWPQTSQRQMCCGMQLPGPWLCFGTGHPHEFFNTRWWALHRCRPIGARRRWANWICRRRPKAPSPPPWMQLFSGESDGIRWLLWSWLPIQTLIIFSSDMYSFLKQSDCLIYTALLHSTMEAYEMFK